MSVEDIKHGIASLSATERNEISAFLFHLRRLCDPEHQKRINARLSDGDPAHWLKPEDFERRLDEC